MTIPALVRKYSRRDRFVGPDAPGRSHGRGKQNIMSHMTSTEDRPRPRIVFEVGETVKVIDGPFFNSPAMLRKSTKNVVA